MTKPHEETWEYVAHYQHIDVPEGGDIGIFVDDRVLDEGEKARLRLAAQAPAMARLLLSLQHPVRGDVYELGCCYFCRASEVQKHATDCELATVLRAAGVLP